MIEVYAPAKEQTIEDGRVMKHLGSPVIGALKNPMAMRVLHSLRRMINKLLTTNDENGYAIIDENTRVVVETFKKNDQDSGFKNWDELEKVIVGKALLLNIKSQFTDGTSFKDAYEAGIKDPQGNKIRHILCFAPLVKNPLAIKKQTYLSKYPYKQNYYAAMGDLYVMCKYENVSKTKTEYKIGSLLDISQNRKVKTPDIEGE